MILKGSFASRSEKQKLKLNSRSAINYSLRILKPVIAGKAATVELKQEAEDLYALEVQAALEETIFNAGGCQSVCYTSFLPITVSISCFLSLLHMSRNIAALTAG